MSERFEWLEDNLQLAHALWAGDETSFEGKHFSAPALTNNPRPISSPHPRIMVGGMGPKKTLRMVAQYADACNLFEGAGIPRVQKAIDDLKGHCETLERDYDSVEKTSLGTVHLADGKESVADVLDRVKALADVGITHAIFNMPNVYEITPLETFAKEIIPVASEL